jgi:cytochrome c oxidase assembly protein subunit 15
LRRFTCLITALAYVQLVLGAQMRHIPVTAGPWLFNISLLLHLANALLLSTAVVVSVISLGRDRGEVALRRPAQWLAGLLGVQLCLGAWTWIVKYGWPHWIASYSFNADFTIQAKSMLQTGISTLHMAMGSLILAAALLSHLRTWQLMRSPEAVGGRR